MNNKQSDNQYILTLQPSQYINLGWYLLVPVSLLVWPPLAILTIIAAIYKYFEVATWKYEIYTRTIVEKKGVFNVSQFEIPYFRIKSVMVDEPLWMRILSLSIVRVTSSEKFKPNMDLYAVSNGEKVREHLSDSAFEWRKEIGIRDYDIFNS
jgi:membrane protein YdbS with pleckstrin-like domain